MQSSLATNIQLDSAGQLKHFLTIQGLDKKYFFDIFQRAETYLDKQGLLKNPKRLLKHKTIINLFFENSTRTRCSFELAAQRLGAEVINFDVGQSSVQKGETLLDTIYTLRAMGADLFVIRHSENGVVESIARKLGNTASVINGGDGTHQHPTQAMLDTLTIYQRKKNFAKLSVAIVGDIAHSRVANSLMEALLILGVNDIRLIGPESLLPHTIKTKGISLFNDMQQGILGVDVIVMLRIQFERIHKTLKEIDNGYAIVSTPRDYFAHYGLNVEKLKYAKPDVIVMHPGPMNRGIEIESAVADGPHSVILQQIANGVAVRMAIMSLLLST